MVQYKVRGPAMRRTVGLHNRTGPRQGWAGTAVNCFSFKRTNTLSGQRALLMGRHDCRLIKLSLATDSRDYNDSRRLCMSQNPLFAAKYYLHHILYALQPQCNCDCNCHGNLESATSRDLIGGAPDQMSQNQWEIMRSSSFSETGKKKERSSRRISAGMAFQEVRPTTAKLWRCAVEVSCFGNDLVYVCRRSQMTAARDNGN